MSCVVISPDCTNLFHPMKSYDLISMQIGNLRYEGSTRWRTLMDHARLSFHSFLLLLCLHNIHTRNASHYLQDNYKRMHKICTCKHTPNMHIVCSDSDIQLSCGDSFLCVPTLRNAFHLFLVYMPSMECTYMYVLYIWWMCFCGR